MSQTRKALGKGLDVLFGGETIAFDKIDKIENLEKMIVDSTPKKEIELISIDEIRSNPYQPRIHFDEDSLNELADSIKEYGVLEPIIVKRSIKGYEIVAGERRTKAAKIAGETKIPAIVKDFTDEQMMEIAILENIQREDLSPIEEAKAYKKFMQKMNLTQEEVAKRFKKSRSYITNIIGLLNLPNDVQKDVSAGIISMSHARVLSKIDDEEQINLLAKRIKNEGISVRELEKLSQGDNITKTHKQVKRVDVSTRLKIYERVLREEIGTKVVVTNNKVTIPFDSEKDLERIMEILNIKVGE